MKKSLLAPQNTFLDTIATRFDGTHSNFVLGNAQAPGCPIVYCSDGFIELTGFTRAQVMGRSCACKFLYGNSTVVMEKDKIDNALEHKEELKTELIFYRKDGDNFKCLLDIVPIKNEKSQVVLILVSHKDISDDKSSDKTNKDDDSDSNGSPSPTESDEEMAEAFRRCQRRRGMVSTGQRTGAEYKNQRRRSRAVLYHLSGQFEKQNRAKSKLQQFNKFSSMSSKMPEYKVQEVKKSKFILVHYGIFKIGWDWLILLCTFYTAIMVPYNAAFTLQEKNQRDSIYSDVVVEILFIFDIVLNFRTSFVNKSGQVVYQARLIALNYIRGWFLLDLLAAIPFDFLYIFNINANAPVHLLKLARLLRLARLLQKIDRFNQYSALVLALLMSMFALLAHWMACIWYAIGNVEFERDLSTAGWLFELGERLDNPIHLNKTNKPDILTSYLAALYFTCSSLTSVGFGNVSANTNPEKIFSICAMLVGALMHAVVFGNVTAIIQRMYQRRANFHSKTKDLKDFFRAYNIPKPLKQRMQEYFQTMWSMNNGIQTSEILKDFPEEMKGELGLHLHKEMLNLPIFEDATPGCLKSIALHTRRSFCAPGEFLVHKGDAANYLYLLSSGSMEILKTDLVVAILGKGDLFGADIDFDDPISVCNYDVRSLTYSEIQCINIKGLTDVLALYPDFAEKFAKDIRNDLTYNLRRSAEDSDETERVHNRLRMFSRRNQETKGSPTKDRVFTLPSISEDEEESDSVDEESKSQEKSRDDDDDDVSQTSRLMSPTASMSSPLLANHRPFKLPNGDIDVFNSPTQARGGWKQRRESQIKAAIKERKLRITGHSADTAERLTPHVIGLQTEVEGTKGSVNKLEKKVIKIGQDISTIDNNMREILKHMTNLQKLTPLEPLQQTPYTPSSAHAHGGFNFSFDNSVQYTSACDSSPMNSDSGFMHEKKEFEPDARVNNAVTTSYNTGNNSSDKTPFFNGSLLDTLPNNTSIIPDLLSRTSEEARQTDINKNLRANKSNDDLLGDTSSLNEHDTLVRRHSDGPEKRNKKEQTIIVTKDIRPGTTDIKTNVDVKEKETKHSNMRNVNFKDVCIPIQSDTDSSQYDDIQMFAKRHYGTNPFIDYHNSPLHDLVTDETRLLNNYTEIHLNGCNAIDSDYRTSTSESYDVSPETPDGATDISESIKTEDEELIPGYTSTNTHTPVTHVHKRCDGIILRTTDL